MALIETSFTFSPTVLATAFLKTRFALWSDVSEAALAADILSTNEPVSVLIFMIAGRVVSLAVAVGAWVRATNNATLAGALVTGGGAVAVVTAGATKTAAATATTTCPPDCFLHVRPPKVSAGAFRKVDPHLLPL